VYRPFLIALLCAGALIQSQNLAASPEADLVLLNGRILTVDAKDSVAEAVGIAGGKIIAVGSNEEVKTRAAKDAHVIDLHGRTATPGLIDTHCHFQEVAALYEIDLSDPSIRQLSDVVRRVQQKVAESRAPGYAAADGTRGNWQSCATSTRRIWTRCRRIIRSG
jgi:predicted amidohydrolase YtcJ